MKLYLDFRLEDVLQCKQSSFSITALQHTTKPKGNINKFKYNNHNKFAIQIQKDTNLNTENHYFVVETIEIGLSYNLEEK